MGSWIMADSDALRMQRYRRHRQGDHAICRHPPLAPVVEINPASAPPGNLDPVAELRSLADRLTGAHQADPGNAAVARELRMTLQMLQGLPEEEIDPLAELRAMMPD
jgi:hypothetical protein